MDVSDFSNSEWPRDLIINMNDTLLARTCSSLNDTTCTLDDDAPVDTPVSANSLGMPHPSGIVETS